MGFRWASCGAVLVTVTLGACNKAPIGFKGDAGALPPSLPQPMWTPSELLPDRVSDAGTDQLTCEWVNIPPPDRPLPGPTHPARCGQYEWFVFRPPRPHDARQILTELGRLERERELRALAAMPRGVLPGINVRGRDAYCWMHLPVQPSSLSVVISGAFMKFQGIHDHTGDAFSILRRFECERVEGL